MQTGAQDSSSIMEAIQAQIEKAKEDGANMLLPSQILSNIPAKHNITIEYVSLSPSPDDGDVYPKQGDENKFILSKQGLMRLCACAGVEWNLDYCGRTDDGTDRDYIAYKMVGAVQKLDGTWYPLPGQYDLDFLVIEEELEDSYIARSKNWSKPQDQKDAYVQKMTRQELLRKRRHKLAIVESGAMLRAIRGLLIIKNSYTAKELENPFVIARLAYQPDYNDPEIRRQLLGAATKAASNVWGPSAHGTFNQVDRLPAPAEGDEIQGAEPDPEPKTGPEPANGPTEPEDPELIDFNNQDRKEQMQTLRDMAAKLGKGLQEFKDAPECKNFTRADFFTHLNTLRNEQDDDIPD